MSALAQYSGGSGTAEDPYRIATAADLILLGETYDDYEKHFILMADIDLSDYVYDRAVFASVWAFLGTFDGNGHIISNLTIDGSDNLALFGYLGGGDDGPYGKKQIKNLGLENVKIEGGDIVGALVSTNCGIISECYSEWVIRTYSLDMRSIYLGHYGVYHIVPATDLFV